MKWLRASQSIPLNIAEGNGKRSPKERARRIEIARGSAFECTAMQDVLIASDGLDVASSCEMKLKLKRIVSMLTRMEMKTDGVAESPAGMLRTSITSTSTAALSTSTTDARSQNHRYRLQRSGRVSRCRDEPAL